VKLEAMPVTGREQKKQLTPQMKALSDFYQALNSRDIELMARNWAPTSDAVMDNPVGGIMRGGKRSELYTSGSSVAREILVRVL